MSHPPLLTELVPRRNSTYLILFAAGVSLILILGGLYAFGLRFAHLTSDGRLAALDLDSEGSIASWCSIVLLLFCGLTTLLVRRLRLAASCSAAERRLWSAVSILWFMMSLDEGASLHEGFKEMMARLTGTRILGDGSIYWIVPYFLLISAAGLFMLWAARRCPAAITCLLSAGMSYAVAVIAQCELFLGNRPAVETWIEESCEMLGGTFILLTLGLVAREVVLELEQSTAAADAQAPYQQGGKGDDNTLLIDSHHEHAGPHWSRKAPATKPITAR